MPIIAENIAERLVLKGHSTGTHDAVTEPTPASDPGATGGEVLRYVDHNLSLTRESYTPNEMREDQQQPIDKLGTRRVPVTINALLSPASQKTLLEAVLRGTWSTAVVTATETQLTSIAADNATSKFTFGGGDPVALGFRVGQIVRPANLSDPDNNGKNFVLLGFTGASNRDVTVSPPPDTMTADLSFTFSTVGRSLFVPSSSLVRRKFALETYNSDSDIAKLYTEIAFHGLTLAAAPNQDVRLGFTGMGRNRYLYSGGAAPFFASPAAAPATDVISSMDGLLQLNGTTVGILTGLEISFTSQTVAPAQMNNTGLAAGVVQQGNRVLSGSFTVWEVESTYHDLYDQETEFSILGYFPASDAAGVAAVSVFLPRVKITAQEVVAVDGAKALRCQYSGSRYLGSGVGIESTSILVHDTAVS